MHQRNTFPLATATYSPKYDSNYTSHEAVFNAFAVRHFGTERGGDSKDADADKKLEGLAPKKSSPKSTDYKKMALDMVKSGASATFLFFRHPTLIPSKLRYTWHVIKEEAHHYYVSTTVRQLNSQE